MNAPTRSQLLPRWAADVAQPVAALVIFVALWEAFCGVFHVRAYLLPPPSAIFTDTTELFGPVVMHTLATGETVLLGFAVSVVISLPLAVLITSSPLIANAVYPLLVLTQAIPKVALAPILVVMLGSNELPRGWAPSRGPFSPLGLPTPAATPGVPPELIKLGRACKASR